MRLTPRSREVSIFRIVAAFLVLALGVTPTAPAGLNIVGNYRCLSYNVSGGGGSCRLAPPLVLNANGTYRMSSERGTWRVVGDRVTFSESKIRGPGKLMKDNRIVFKYTYRGWQHTITYGCTDCGSGAK